MANDFVTVGCKLPNGLTLVVRDDAGLEKVRFTVAGRAIYRQPNIDRKNYTPPSLAFGDGLTMVPKDIWEAWEKQNKVSDVVKKGIIYARGTENDTKAQARDTQEIRTGLEPINPTDPGLGLKPTKETLQEMVAPTIDSGKRR